MNLSVTPVLHPLTNKQQAVILQDAATATHQRLGRIPIKTETSPDDWSRYLILRRRAALDLTAELVVCQYLEIDGLPPWLSARAKQGHYRSLRLDFSDLGQHRYMALVTLEADGAKFWGVAPLEWVATAELDFFHPFRGLDRNRQPCVDIPAALLVDPQIIRDRYGELDAGTAEFPRPEMPAPMDRPLRVNPAPPAELAHSELSTYPPDPGASAIEISSQPLQDAADNQPSFAPGIDQLVVAANLRQFIDDHPDQVAFGLPDGSFVTQAEFEALPPEQQVHLPFASTAPPRNEIEASPGQMARGVLQAAGQLLTGGLASRVLQSVRWNTCLACPHFTTDHRCSKCGCYMKAKIAVAQATCPDNRWPV